MESFDIMTMNTRLPPRKRLLAGFLRENSCTEFLPPIPVLSGELGARIREVINSPNSTLDEIIEVAESVAIAATEVAAIAKRKAIEKEIAASKAKANAKSALELLGSVSSYRRSKMGYWAKNRVKKKQVPIKLFYKTSRRSGSQETDEELARRLHHAMNSSARISSNKRKGFEESGIEVVISNSDVLRDRNAHGFLSESVCVADEQFVDKLDEKMALCSKDGIFIDDEGESVHCNDIFEDRSEIRSRKPMNSRKKQPSRHLNVTRQQESKSSSEFSDKESNRECTKRIVAMEDVTGSIDDGTMKKISSIWKYKKLKMSQCSYDNKFLPALC